MSKHTREHIVDEIKRTAADNRGRPLGYTKFYKVTRISRDHWGDYWPRWTDAVRDAGFEANFMRFTADERAFMSQMTGFIRALGRSPTDDEIRDAYSDEICDHRWGFLGYDSFSDLMDRVREYARVDSSASDVVALLPPQRPPQRYDRPETIRPSVRSGDEDDDIFIWPMTL